HRLAFLDSGEVGWTDGEVDPDSFEIDDHEQFRFEVVASDCRAEIDLALDHPTPDRSAYFLLWQRVDRLFRQRRYLLFAEAEAGKLLPGHFHRDARILSGRACAQVVVFRGGLPFPQHLRPVEQGLFQIMTRLPRQIFALGVCNLAALEDGEHLALSNG